jgi:hypothetical protein
MIPAAALILALTGHAATQTEARYARAIDAATTDTRTRVVLAVVAHAETRCHADSPTPPFGLTDWTSTHGRRPSIEEGARLAVATLDHIRTVRCPGAELAVVLGWYSHGFRGRAHGCHSDFVSRREVRRVERLQRIAATWRDDGP